MKIFVTVLVCLVSVAHSLSPAVIDEFKQHLLANFEYCVKEENASPADIEALMKKTIPESHEGKCVLFCMHKKCHAQNEDGSVNVDGAIQGVDKFKEDPEVHEKLVTSIKGCSTSVTAEADPCVFAAKLAECLINGQKSNGLDQIFIK